MVTRAEKVNGVWVFWFDNGFELVCKSWKEMLRMVDYLPINY